MKRTAKFRVGQVVIVNGDPEFPIKLDERVVVPEVGVSWIDILGGEYDEADMRPVNAREIGPRPAKGRKG